MKTNFIWGRDKCKAWRHWTELSDILTRRWNISVRCLIFILPTTYSEIGDPSLYSKQEETPEHTAETTQKHFGFCLLSITLTLTKCNWVSHQDSLKLQREKE